MEIGKAKVSEKGWIVIPKQIREVMELRPGDEVQLFFWPSLQSEGSPGHLSVFKDSGAFRSDRGAFKYLRGEKPITEELVDERRAEVEREERDTREWRRGRRTSA